MWCVSPAWPAHARHVAVEFVHPVIVGTRALPAVAVEGRDPVATLQASVRPVDVLVVLGTADDPEVRDLLARAPAWGVETVWIGVGERPDANGVDHVLWLEGADPGLAFSGRLVAIYHVLWEMTHVCFEHPGLLVPQVPECRDEVCITCSDEGRIGEVLAVRDDGLADVRTADGEEGVDVTLVTPVVPGDLVLVHAGTALSRIDPVERAVP